MNDYFVTPLDHAQSRAEKPFKHTFFQSDRLLAGLNCLLPGQKQPIHDHVDQDKFYYVVAGVGLFTVGDAEKVLALPDGRNGLGLDRGRCGVSLAVERFQKRRCKTEVSKFGHKSLSVRDDSLNAREAGASCHSRRHRMS